MKINLSKRKIGYTYGSLSGEYSFRGGKSIPHESSVERDFLAILEYNSNVIDVISQPMTIPYTNHNGNNVTYTPDYLVHFNNQKSWLVEIKQIENLQKNWGKYRPKFKIGFRHAKDEGWIFHIIHNLKIRTEKLDRAKYLGRFKFHTGQNDFTKKIISHLRPVNYISISELINTVFPREDKNEVTHHIFHLLTKQVLFCDLNHELDANTVIWLNHNSGEVNEH